MTYASIEEAWGGVSGSNMLSTPLHKRQHPIHIKQKENFTNTQKWKNEDDLYQCSYGSQHCNQVYKTNQNFNEQKKMVAAGMQPYPLTNQNVPFTFLPQYPWYPLARNSYLMYGPQVSQMFYSNPWMAYPYVANQIAMNQQYTTPIGPYQPQGFIPLDYKDSMDPPVKHNQREHFTDPVKMSTFKNGMIYFIFFLISLAVILVIAMICLCKN